MLSRPRRIGLAFLLTALVAAPAGRAQVLADRLPTDALLYAGWAGSDALGPAYDASHFKAFLDSLNLPPSLAERFTAAFAAPADAPQNTLFALLSAVAKSPSAVYVGPPDFAQNPAQPVPRIAIISRLGKDPAAQLAPKIHAAFQTSRRPQDPPMAATAIGEFLLLSVGDVHLADRLTGNAPADSLAKAAAFQNALKQLGPDAAQSAAFVYIDGQTAVPALLHAAQSNPDIQKDLIDRPGARAARWRWRGGDDRSTPSPRPRG